MSVIKKWIHTGDRHLRASQWGYSSRGLDFFKSAIDVHRVAVEQKVRVIVDAGDLIDNTRPSPDVTDQVKQLDRDLIAKGLCTVAVEGNHDGTGANHWIHQVTDQEKNRRDKTGIIFIRNEVIEVDGMTFYGMESCNRERFIELSAAAPSADVLIWHGAISDMAPMPKDWHVRPEDIRWDKFRFVAMGDLHFREYRMGATPAHMYGYPGSTELVSVSEDPCKTVTQVTITDDAIATDYFPIKSKQVYSIKGATAEQLAADVESVYNDWKASGEPHCIVVAEVPTTLQAQPLVYARFSFDKCLLRVNPRKVDMLSFDVAAAGVDNAAPVKTVQDFAGEYHLKDNDLREALMDGVNGRESISDSIEKWLKKREVTV